MYPDLSSAGRTTMSMYADQHPFTKQAAINLAGISSTISRYAAPAYMRNAIRSHIPEILAGTLGLAGGAYMGNKAYQNTIPPVKALPRLNHEPLVEPYYQNPLSTGKA